MPVLELCALSARLELPDEVLIAYEDQAAHRGIPLDELLSKRLSQSVTFTASRPLYFDDEQRQKLEQLLGKNVANPVQALALIAKAVIISVHNVKVHLKPDLITRLQTRCFDRTPDGNKDFDGFLAKLVRTSLAQFCGY